jgi:hypothetical protein
MPGDRKAQLASSFAGARKRFLSISHPASYAALVKTGQLESHLLRIGAEAADHYLTLEDQLKRQAAKIAEDRERQAYLSQIPHMAREMVLSEIVEITPE